MKSADKPQINKIIKVHWLHSKGLEATMRLLFSPNKKQICLDKDTTAEAILRSTLDRINIVPKVDLKIHLWELHVDKYLHYFFLDDEQNKFIQSENNSVCSID